MLYDYLKFNDIQHMMRKYKVKQSSNFILELTKIDYKF